MVVLNKEIERFYIKELRDLEIARAKVEKTFNKEKSSFDSESKQLNLILMSKPTKTYPALKETTEYKILKHWFTLILSLYFLIFTVVLGAADHMPFIFYLWNWGIGFVFLTPTLLDRDKVKKENTAIEAKNNQIMREKKEDEDKYQQKIKEASSRLNVLSKQWDEKKIYLDSEIKKIDTLLQKYYDVDCLESKFRNVQSLIDIYHFMSMNNLSLENCLADMEQSISNGYELKQDTRQFMLERIVESKDDYTINQTIELLDKCITSEMVNIYHQMRETYINANDYFKEASYLIQE